MVIDRLGVNENNITKEQSRNTASAYQLALILRRNRIHTIRPDYHLGDVVLRVRFLRIGRPSLENRPRIKGFRETRGGWEQPAAQSHDIMHTWTSNDRIKMCL